jgi:hypothetical protein
MVYSFGRIGIAPGVMVEVYSDVALRRCPHHTLRG